MTSASHAHDTPPGPLAEEAARLVEALSEWARTHAGDLPGAAAAATAGMGSAAECRICPLCQAVALLRQARPETFAHLLEASAALTAALRSVVDTGASGRRPGGGVERITLDEDLPV